MIFKEESILRMILLESPLKDDWLKIAEESDAYGYAIIKPTEKWIPARHSFSEEEGMLMKEAKRQQAQSRLVMVGFSRSLIRRCISHHFLGLAEKKERL